MIRDWDKAYENAARIPDADGIVAGWSMRAGTLRRNVAAQVVSTGDGARQFLDLYRPELASQGLTVIVHGGYWMDFDGRAFAHLAAGPLARGQAVAMVTYTLAPEARIGDISNEVSQAVTIAAAMTDGPIRLAGHSAGGHLVCRMICAGMLPPEVASRITHVVSISGLHDLRPLLRTKMNKTLRLTPEEAARESPALLCPIGDARLTCVVGAGESPEFLRQSRLLANIWAGLGAQTTCIELPGENHFSVIAGLETAQGPITRLLLA